jgi:hypothetical protein
MTAEHFMIVHFYSHLYATGVEVQFLVPCWVNIRWQIPD